MEDNITFVVKGLSINNYVSASASGSASGPTPGTASAEATASPETTSTDACASSPPEAGFSNTSQLNSTQLDMIQQMLQQTVGDMSKRFTDSHNQILQELKEIREAQEKNQKNLDVQDKDREKYLHLQHQYMNLKQKLEETTSRLKALTTEKYELITALDALNKKHESLQNEVDKLHERQASDDQNHLSEIQSKESEIEDLKKTISELEKKLASSDELHRTDALHIDELEEKIKRLKEEKGNLESGNIALLKEVDILTNTSSRSRVETEVERVLTVNSLSTTIECNNITENQRLPFHLDKRKTRPVIKSFTNPRYTTPKPQAFVGTTSSKSSHNVVHKKAQLFNSMERR